MLFAALPMALGLHAQEVLTLEQCLGLATEHNKRVQAAQFGVDAAEAAQRSAAANALPAFDASVMGVYLSPPLGGAFGGMVPDKLASGAVNTSLPLYAGGRVRNGKAAAAIGTDIAREQLRMTTADVLFATERAYWQVVQVDEKVKLATAYQAMLKTFRNDLQHSFDAGLIFKNDLLRVQVALNEAELGLREAQDGAVLVRMQLAQLIGKPTEAGLALADTTVTEHAPVPTLDAATALANRPELRTLEKVAEVEDVKVKLLQGERLPTLGLAASGMGTFGQRVNIDDGSNSMFMYYGIANLSMPLFDWGKQGNKVKEQRAKATAQRAELEDTRELLALEVRNAELHLERTTLAVPIAELSLRQAEENLRLAIDRMKAGTITAKDVQEAQAIWQEAHSALIDARVGHRISEAAYRKATGTME